MLIFASKEAGGCGFRNFRHFQGKGSRLDLHVFGRRRKRWIRRGRPTSVSAHRWAGDFPGFFRDFCFLEPVFAPFGRLANKSLTKRKTTGNLLVSSGLAWCKMVGVVELESTTSTMSTWRSNQLSYTPSIQIENSIYYTIDLRKVKRVFAKKRKKGDRTQQIKLKTYAPSVSSHSDIQFRHT